MEVLIYLLSNESGNSNAIAKEIFYDQKSVYRILENKYIRCRLIDVTPYYYALYVMRQTLILM